jgi:hypothetical protein
MSGSPADLPTFIHDVCVHMGADPPSLPTDLNTLSTFMRHLLAQNPHGAGNLTIILDSLDGLCDDDIRLFLESMPHLLPSNIKCVLVATELSPFHVSMDA